MFLGRKNTDPLPREHTLFPDCPETQAAFAAPA
jgi:hypothetical protein